jgi:hypothetical protein
MQIFLKFIGFICAIIAIICGVLAIRGQLSGHYCLILVFISSACINGPRWLKKK